MIMVKGMKKTRLFLECLEDRLTPDASVSMVAGNLVIRGTDRPEAFVIEKTHSGTITFTAQGGTTFNGGQTRIVSHDFDLSSVDIQLRGGADTLIVRDVTVFSGMSIDMGDDADSLTLENLRYIFNVDLDMGRGNDRVTLRGVVGEAPSVWMLGMGDDTVTLSAGTKLTNATWDLGEGSDIYIDLDAWMLNSQLNTGK